MHPCSFVARRRSALPAVTGDIDPSVANTAGRMVNLGRGMIGLWTGNASDGDFANLRITHMK